MLTQLQPVPELAARVKNELAHVFSKSRPIRLSRAPGRLDVMGGIADYTGSLVCEATIDRAAAVALQARDDRQFHVYSLNLKDARRPYAFDISLDALAGHSIESLRAAFDASSRWAGYLVGCLYVLHANDHIDLRDPRRKGATLCIHSTVPLGAGVSSSAAIEVATMMNLVAHYDIAGRLDALAVARLCQQVENQVVGAPCGIMDQVSSCAGSAGSLLRMVCQPHELRPPLKLPAGVRAVGINSNVKHSVGGGAYGKTRCAAFMGHRIIVGDRADDPTGGYLANLPAETYRGQYRDLLPGRMRGDVFLSRYEVTRDTATTVNEHDDYHVRRATDHHVFEAGRVRRFDTLLSAAGELSSDASAERAGVLHGAGALMYESHRSYGENAMLGAAECTLLVDLVRSRAALGLYGAKITGGGSGGTVAILCDASARVDQALSEILLDYKRQTGLTAELILGSSPGAWESGTELVALGDTDAN